MKQCRQIELEQPAEGQEGNSHAGDAGGPASSFGMSRAVPETADEDYSQLRKTLGSDTHAGTALFKAYGLTPAWIKANARMTTTISALPALKSGF